MIEKKAKMLMSKNDTSNIMVNVLYEYNLDPIMHWMAIPFINFTFNEIDEIAREYIKNDSQNIADLKKTKLRSYEVGLSKMKNDRQQLMKVVKNTTKKIPISQFTEFTTIDGIIYFLNTIDESSKFLYKKVNTYIKKYSDPKWYALRKYFIDAYSEYIKYINMSLMVLNSQLNQLLKGYNEVIRRFEKPNLVNESFYDLYSQIDLI